MSRPIATISNWRPRYWNELALLIQLTEFSYVEAIPTVWRLAASGGAHLFPVAPAATPAAPRGSKVVMSFAYYPICI